MGLFGVVPVLSSGAGRLRRRHEGPLLPFTERHHGPGPKVSGCVDLLCSSHMCEEFASVEGVVFIFGSDILVKASVVFVVCVLMEHRNDKHVDQKVQYKNNAV